MELQVGSILVLLETCRVSCRSKFGKLVHLVGFIIKTLFRSVIKTNHFTLYG